MNKIKHYFEQYAFVLLPVLVLVLVLALLVLTTRLPASVPT